MTYSTIYGERITKADYLALRAGFIQRNPTRSWGLTEEVEGECYYIEPADTAVCVNYLPGIDYCEVQGAFKMTHAPAYEPGALGVNKLLSSLGYRIARLTCFEPVYTAWAQQGWRQHSRASFDANLAPSAWNERYGRPDVLTMWRLF